MSTRSSPGEQHGGSAHAPASLLLRALLIVATLAVLWVGLDPLRPTPRDASAPPDAFSAARAFTTVQAIARGPHPTGHPAQGPIRSWLVAMLESLGLSVEVQERLVIGDEGLPEQHPGETPEGWAEAVRVHNIVARLPARRSGLTSTAPRPEGRHALMLSAHYDARGAAPGAADDASGVAIILEVLRALELVPDREREVIVLLSDAEELGLDGARAFASAHPAAQEVAVTINLEARGNGGRSRMFETTAGNVGWIDAYDRSGAMTTADSLSASIYRRMPRDTDLTVLRQVGIAGYNFAFIRGLEHYHTPLDTPANLDRGTLQEQGDAVLALARTLVRGELPDTAERDAMFFSLAGETWVLSPGMGHALALLALVLALGTLAQRVSLGAVTVGGIVRAAGVGTLLAIAAAATLHFAGQLIVGWLHEGWTHPSPLTANAMPVLAALVTVGGSVLLLLWRRLRHGGERPFARIELVAAGVVVWVLVTLVLEIFLPRASYLGSLPLIGAAFLLLGQDERGTRGTLGHVLSLGVLPALALWPRTLDGVGVAFGVGAVGALVLAGAMLLPLAAPLLAAVTPAGLVIRTRWIPLFAGLVCLGTLVAVAQRPGVPLAASVSYFADAETRSARWFTFDRRPGEFVARVMRLRDEVPVPLVTNLDDDPATRDALLALRGGHRHDDADFVYAKETTFERQPEVTARVSTISTVAGEAVERVAFAVPEGTMALDVIPDAQWRAVEILDGATWRPLADSVTRFRLVAPPREVVMRVRVPVGVSVAGAVIVMRDGIPGIGGADGAERGEGEMPSEGDRTFVRVRFGGE